MEEWLVLLAAKSVILLALAAVVTALLGSSSAAVRHLVWLLALCSLLLLPLFSLAVPAWRPDPGPRLRSVAAPAIVVVDVIAEEGAGGRPWTRTVPWLWAAGALVLLLRSGVARVRAARLSRRAAFYRDIAGTPVRISAEVDVPLVCGAFQPAIVLPEEAPEWPEERLRLVLAHEKTHVARGDTWALAAGQLACALYWPNPLVWWAASRLRRECEQACDDAVLAGGEKPSVYAGHLVEIIRGLSSPVRSTEGGIAMIGITEIERRIAALLNPKRSRRAAGKSLAGAGVVVALALLAPLAAWRAPAQTGATLSGVVRDASGATIPRAQVTLFFAGEDRKEFAITSDTGDFSFTPLPGGFYRVEVAKPGFALYEAGEIALSESAPLKMDIVLSLGRIRERVEVKGERAGTPAPRPDPGVTPTRIRVGGHVQAPKRVHMEQPSYPADCKADGVEGTVLLRTVISREGIPLNLTPVNQFVDQRLVRAAMDAVNLWRYEATLLNGAPVEVITEIQVNFTLSR